MTLQASTTPASITPSGAGQRAANPGCSWNRAVMRMAHTAVNASLQATRRLLGLPMEAKDRHGKDAISLWSSIAVAVDVWMAKIERALMDRSGAKAVVVAGTLAANMASVHKSRALLCAVDTGGLVSGERLGPVAYDCGITRPPLSLANLLRRPPDQLITPLAEVDWIHDLTRWLRGPTACEVGTKCAQLVARSFSGLALLDLTQPRHYRSAAMPIAASALPSWRRSVSRSSFICAANQRVGGATDDSSSGHTRKRAAPLLASFGVKDGMQRRAFFKAAKSASRWESRQCWLLRRCESTG